MNAAVALAVGLIFGAGVRLVMARELVRIAAGSLMLTNTAILFILSTGFRERGEPIHPAPGQAVTDPVTQAMGLTAIVIGFASSALLLALVYRAHGAHGSIDLAELVRAELAEERHLTGREPGPEEEE